MGQRQGLREEETANGCAGDNDILELVGLEAQLCVYPKKPLPCTL